MRYSLPFVITCSLLLSTAAHAGTAEESARASAKKRGYTAAQPQCFVPIFGSYAHQTKNGSWLAGGNSASAQAYKHEVWSKCGIQR